MMIHSCELTAGITTLANVIGSKLTAQELSLLAAVCTQLGDTLATIAVQKSMYDDRDNG